MAVIKNVANSRSKEEIDDLLRKEESYCRRLFQNMKISEHPNISCWRKAYTDFGAGSHYRSSVEALVKRVIRGQNVPSINKLVDIYNLISLKHLVPVGGENLGKVKGNIELALANGEEKFRAINSQEEDPPKKGEVVYRDESQEVLCRRFN